ncbi:uncharacterized protein LOC108678209 [Hyalella azteca]|uniref:Uncharacterized protein LOC108678209 n=1 Tax=Hyalella azteca TaxID=294128 RepID=A0A8B7P7X5_HYAAZ|nr:uncharacterized protein LOC108678209 [Hyalella azteca]
MVNMKQSLVSWIRRKDLHVLTTDTMTYTSDGRFRAVHAAGSPFWMLEIDSPQARDEGVYECQVSSQPKIYRRFQLQVTEPKASIVGSSEVFMKLGSDINITCVVTGHTPPLNVVWYHTTTNAQGEVVRTEITTGDRGGVQLVTDRKQGTSWLLVDRASKPDAGNYTCAPPHTVPAHVTVHVIQAEEAPAAMTPELANGGSSLWRRGSFYVKLYPAGARLLYTSTKCVVFKTDRPEFRAPFNYNNFKSKSCSCSASELFCSLDDVLGRTRNLIFHILEVLIHSSVVILSSQLWLVVAVGGAVNAMLTRVQFQQHPAPHVTEFKIFLQTNSNKQKQIKVNHHSLQQDNNSRCYSKFVNKFIENFNEISNKFKFQFSCNNVHGVMSLLEIVHFSKLPRKKHDFCSFSKA